MYKLTTDDLDSTAPEVSLSLDELAREGARRLIAAALRLEADEHVEKMRDLRDDGAQWKSSGADSTVGGRSHQVESPEGA